MSAQRALVVDDDLAARLRLSDLLRVEEAWEVRESVDGREALEVAKDFRPDLIILDLMLPSMTGYELCAALRNHPATREVPIIVVSAVEESEARIKVLNAGADDFLEKPFFATELRAKIRGVARLNRFRALVRERDRFRWMVESSAEPVVIVDAQGRVIYANAESKRVFGLDNRFGIDASVSINQYFRAEPEDAWVALRSGRLTTGDSFHLCRPESDQLPAQWFKVEIHAFDVEGSQTVLKFTDRSRCVQRELEIFTFQHLIAHKIRTPLTGIAPILSLLAENESVGSDENATLLLKMAQQSAHRLQDTLLGILQYHEALFAPRTPGFFNETHTFTNLIAAASRAAGLEGRVRLSGPDGKTSHGETLELVLTELFDNYRKFSDASASGVEVSILVRTSGQWSISLCASGPGLPPQVFAELGQPYRQLERSLCGEVPGIGLGLAITRLLLRSMGGDLEFACPWPRGNFCTTVVLPGAVVEALDAQVA